MILLQPISSGLDELTEEPPGTDSVPVNIEELQISRLIDTGAPLTVESRICPGDSVRIKSGPMAGLEGRVIHRRGKTRLLVAVKMLHQGVSLEIDDFQLEPLV